MKVLLIGATFSNNRGSAAMLISCIKSLRFLMPDLKISVLSIFYEQDKTFSDIYNVAVIKDNSKFIKKICFFIRVLISKLFQLDSRDCLLQEYTSSDVIIDLSGDGFSDDYGVVETLGSCYDIILSKLLSKPFVIYAQSIGPFNNIFTRMISKHCLDKVDLLMVRDEITDQYLKKIGIKNKIYLTADVAMILDAVDDARCNEIIMLEKINDKRRPIVGISSSQHIFELCDKDINNNVSNPYIFIMAEIIKYLIKEINAQIIFIPHVTNNQSIDDRYVAREIYKLIDYKDKITLIENEYSPEELKAIIGKCDLFIGARMHANIAATSMCVPTLAISYSHKTGGIMKMLGLEKYVVNFRTMTIEDIIVLVDDLWKNKEQITNHLKKRICSIKKSALQNSELVKELIESIC